jgi:NAD(P)-dependent dehydrogenase (short-subunit alcohol dehydrogenase family)
MLRNARTTAARLIANDRRCHGRSFGRGDCEHSPGAVGDPRNIAEMVVFLGSSCAQWITGQNFIVSGGE